MPFLQTLVGTALFAAIVLAATGEASFWAGGPVWMLVFIYVLGFGGTSSARQLTVHRDWAKTEREPLKPS